MRKKILPLDGSLDKITHFCIINIEQMSDLSRKYESNGYDFFFYFSSWEIQSLIHVGSSEVQR